MFKFWYCATIFFYILLLYGKYFWWYTPGARFRLISNNDICWIIFLFLFHSLIADCLCHLFVNNMKTSFTKSVSHIQIVDGMEIDCKLILFLCCLSILWVLIFEDASFSSQLGVFCFCNNIFFLVLSKIMRAFLHYSYSMELKISKIHGQFHRKEEILLYCWSF